MRQLLDFRSLGSVGQPLVHQDERHLQRRFGHALPRLRSVVRSLARRMSGRLGVLRLRLHRGARRHSLHLLCPILRRRGLRGPLELGDACATLPGAVRRPVHSAHGERLVQAAWHRCLPRGREPRRAGHPRHEACHVRGRPGALRLRRRQRLHGLQQRHLQSLLRAAAQPRCAGDRLGRRLHSGPELLGPDLGLGWPDEGGRLRRQGVQHSRRHHHRDRGLPSARPHGHVHDHHNSAATDRVHVALCHASRRLRHEPELSGAVWK
mmetsp:Transcript_60456/g.162865  ORF Transcript_60456/g.162865 Transcript_60456/m.162865 type:complete len:265 (+) Transcript_60456:855-1649(+)